MAGRYGITRGTPKGGHGGATPRFQAPRRRPKKLRAARARRVRRERRKRP